MARTLDKSQGIDPENAAALGALHALARVRVKMMRAIRAPQESAVINFMFHRKPFLRAGAWNGNALPATENLKR